MYEHNYEVLSAIVAEGAVIRHVSKHRLPDGRVDIAGNLKIWNDAIARFEQIPLWEEGAPGFRPELASEHPQPSIIFVPAQNATGPHGTVIVACGGYSDEVVSILRTRFPERFALAVLRENTLEFL